MIVPIIVFIILLVANAIVFELGRRFERKEISGWVIAWLTDALRHE